MRASFDFMLSRRLGARNFEGVAIGAFESLFKVPPCRGKVAEEEGKKRGNINNPPLRLTYLLLKFEYLKKNRLVLMVFRVFPRNSSPSYL